MIESPLLSLSSQSGETPLKNTPTYSLQNCKRSNEIFGLLDDWLRALYCLWLSIRWNPYRRIPTCPAQGCSIALPLQLHSSNAETLYIIIHGKYSTMFYFCIPVNFWIRTYFSINYKNMLSRKYLLASNFIVALNFQSRKINQIKLM